tara:strand:+ start:6837 stop:7370 length:534 start_codon:yes stop_codon:yes gene_type:complete
MNEQCEQTLNEMLYDRNFTEIFEFEENTEFYIIDNKLVIYVVQLPKIGINIVKTLQTFLEENDLFHVMLLYKDNITSFAKSGLDDLQNKNVIIECFHINELMYNVTKHSLVPKHELMSKDFLKTLLKELKTTEKHLPKIKQCDPIARYYGANLGDLFKITRKSENSYETTYYRLVCR